ncbi:hypothetical protein BC833DRAFT_176348 [Globomyces pollinis-pini]|nr:hypothetical protein BC833DRAFT_176348 [Globomyces pollinis-pini]
MRMANHNFDYIRIQNPTFCHHCKESISTSQTTKRCTQCGVFIHSTCQSLLLSNCIHWDDLDRLNIEVIPPKRHSGLSSKHSSTQSNNQSISGHSNHSNQSRVEKSKRDRRKSVIESREVLEKFVHHHTDFQPIRKPTTPRLNKQIDPSTTHNFVITTFGKFTYCDHCNNFIFGIVKQGYRCTDCQYTIHRKCKHEVIQICNNQEIVTVLEKPPTLTRSKSLKVDKKDDENYHTAEFKVTDQRNKRESFWNL